MPREVALALRGPGYHPPFDAEPPLVATAPVDVERLRATGQHASAAALEAVRRLVALLDREPLPTVQAGGVGVRELRKAAKRLGGDEATVRLWLESAACAGLVALADDAAMLTVEADQWLAADPAPAMATVLMAWWGAPIVPTHRTDDRDKPMPALSRGWGEVDAAQLRADVLGALASLGAGRGIVDEDEVATLLAFRKPIVHGAPGIRPAVRATLAEARLLGVVADGALTPLGHDLLAAARTEDPPASLASALAGALPGLTRTATFLPDLTAIVPGAAAPELARLLDDTAVAESRDAASTWRFTPESVRGALDAGRSSDELLAALEEVADNPLPQPLEYLVRDVARRHGQVQVFAVTSCVRVADAALGAEIAANRTLAGLELRVLADTVLASSASITDTISALRKAGYAPVRQDARGTTVVERTKRQRAEIARRWSPAGRREASDVENLAALLAGRKSASAHAVGPLLREEDVPLLQPAEVRVLGHAIAEQLPILIDYVNVAGNRSRRVVEPRGKMFDTLVAFCREKQADRNFLLRRITAVSPVPD
jgi:Helicase conserved C-terminal domain